MKFVTTEISDDDWGKVRQDLHLVNVFKQLSKKLDFRVVVTNGYAVDGNLGTITRPHRDVDLIVHTRTDDSLSLMNKVLKIINKDQRFGNLKLSDKGREEFYHWYFIEGDGVGVDVYVVRVVGDLESEIKEVVKRDGSLSEPHGYHSRMVELCGVEFEAVDAKETLRLKLEKKDRPERKKYGNDDRDILNLRTFMEEDHAIVR